MENYAFESILTDPSGSGARGSFYIARPRIGFLNSGYFSKN